MKGNTSTRGRGSLQGLPGPALPRGRAEVAKEALDLAATARPVVPRVDQRDVERGADDLQVMGAKRAGAGRRATIPFR